MRTLEFIPTSDFLSDVKMLKTLIDALNIDMLILPDMPASMPKANSIVVAKMCQDFLGIGCIACISSSDKGLKCIESMILGAEYAGLEGIVCVGGDGSGIDILKIAQGKNIPIKACVYGGGDPSSIKAKADMGANMIITQPIYNPNQMPDSLLSSVGSMDMFLSFMPFLNSSSALRVNSLNLGIEIPQSYISSIESDPILPNIKVLKILLSVSENLHISSVNLHRDKDGIIEIFQKI